MASHPANLTTSSAPLTRELHSPPEPNQAHVHVQPVVTPPAHTSALPPAGNEDHLVSALHAAFRSLSTTQTSSAVEIDMVSSSSPFGKDKEKQHTNLDIVVASDQLCMKGTGVDVEPALLSGNVVLNLTEATSIKQITLVFRGKARVPTNPNDPGVLNHSSTQYIVCNHEWSFLEGEKKHSHTLKPGRHLFPFELRLGGSLPSSIATYVNGGASISYKLRATASRPGLSANLTASLPISVHRTFAHESLEYQQTLEIENTWPDKLMYALMIPHKAWAAGDALTALVKFAPLAKGVRVLSVSTFLSETTKTLAKGGHLEKTRNVVSRKHEINRGNAVPCTSGDDPRRRLQNMLQRELGADSARYQYNLSAHSSPFPPSASGSGSGNGYAQPASRSGSSSPGGTPGNGSASAFVSGTSTPIVDGLGLMRPDSHDSGSSHTSNSSSEEVRERVDLEEEGESEVSTSITIPLPASLTPSHSLDPIIVSYRIRWSILLSNLDGHTSELRCSLPIHILDHSLLDEARKATSATRRLLFGGDDAERDAEEEDAQLPSYPSHVRDRVAMDVTLPEAHAFHPYAHNALESGAATPMETALNFSDFPGFAHTMPSFPSSLVFQDGSPLSYTPPRTIPPFVEGSSRSPPPEAITEENSRPNSRHGEQQREPSRPWHSITHRASRISSRAGSRANSRAPSPERQERDHVISSGASSLLSMSGVPPEPAEARADETHVHSNNPASRQQHGLFNAMMKPLTSITAQWSHSHSHALALAQSQHSSSHSRSVDSGRSMTLPLSSMSAYSSTSTSPFDTLSNSHTPETPGSASTTSSSYISQRSFTLVPDYNTASHSGSGLPPLETLRDLPTYEDSELQAQATGSNATRSFSDTDLMSHFARARAGAMTPMNQSRRVR